MFIEQFVFSFSLHSALGVLVMMMNYWWNFFPPFPRLPSSIPWVFVLVVSFLWSPSCCRAIAICLRLNCESLPSWLRCFNPRERDSNYEFTIFNGAVVGWLCGQMMEDARECQFSLFRVTSQFTVDISTKCPEECYKIFSVLFAANVSCTVSGKSSRSEKRRRRAESKELCKSSAFRFFFGADVYENGN